MAAGAGQVIFGVEGFTCRIVDPVVDVHKAVFVGVKVTDKVCGPAPRIVPLAGE
jgi:hypothetical protein